MAWPEPPAPGMFCATPYRAALREATAAVQASVLRADWPAMPGVHALTTLRGPAGDSQAPFDRLDLGLRNGDDPGVVTGNRRMLVQGLGLPGEPRWLKQVHGTAVAVEPDAGMETEADAAVTREAGVVLAILTADCLPVVLASSDGGVLGIAHAGWRGLAAGVLEATIAGMRVAPATVLAWLGPAAGPDAYEVGAEVRDAFLAHDAQASGAFSATRPGHWRADLYRLARHRLVSAGLRGDAIHGGGLCTISDPRRFYSHRRDQRTGRMATLAWRDVPGPAGLAD